MPATNGPRSARICFNTPACLIGGLCWMTGSVTPATAVDEVITFNRHIAPIIFEHCASCHRPGESGPFSLLTYDDAKKRARQLAEVTARRYMPPWLPEPGFGQFLGERRLSHEQIARIQRWFDTGAVQGPAADLPPTPKWTDGWQLGEPDLVLKMAPACSLGPEGAEVYRNFVLPLPIDERRH